MLYFAPYIFGIWLIFWIYWFVKAFDSKSNRSRSTGFVGFRIILVVIALLLIRSGFLKSNVLTDHNVVLQTIGFIVFLAGLALAVWARVYLGRNWGMPMTKKHEPELVTTGPYQYIRHPIYTGILTAMVGTAVASTFYWLLAVVIIGAYFIYSATVEEKNMGEQLTKVYPGYKKRTKMLIPFIF